jgi:hypothetical protein
MGRYLDLLDEVLGEESLGNDKNDINDLIPVTTAQGGIRSFKSFMSYSQELAELEAKRPDLVELTPSVQAISDARRFLAEWGAKAERLGWMGQDLFGLHLTAPLARYDLMGLVWLLRGRPVIALTETEALIRNVSGSTLRFRRISIKQGYTQ